MQPPVVMSFRARLRFCGYTDIHIKRKKFIDQELYFVSCKDPFCGIECHRYMTIEDMYVWR